MEPHQGEKHVDLLSWVGFYAKTLESLAGMIGADKDMARYQRHYQGIQKALEGAFTVFVS